jgi:hypothetical protein
MKIFFPILTIIAAGLLLLATSCQQTNKGESKSRWQLSSPPGTAAGYGGPPVETNDTHKDTLSHPPAINDSPPQQTETENEGPSSSAPSLKVEPPPSAAGYGRPPQDSEDRKESFSAPSSSESSPDKSTTISEPATMQPDSPQPSAGGYGPGDFTPTWTIEPPPSAAGYGK